MRLCSDTPSTRTDGTNVRVSFRFVAVFTVAASLLSFAYYFPYESGSPMDASLNAYLRWYAYCVGWAIRMLDPSVSISDLGISGRFAMKITRDCDGMQIIILYGVAVLAFPSTWRHRAIGFAVGILALATANLVRLCSLYFVGVYRPDAFDFAHRELWPVVFIVLAVGIFSAWARVFRDSARASA